MMRNQPTDRLTYPRPPSRSRAGSRRGPAGWTGIVLALLMAGIAEGEVVFNEPGRNGSLPAGWTADAVTPETGAGGYLRFTNATAWLVSPVLDLSEYEDVLLSFSVAKFGVGIDGPLTVQVSTNGGESWAAQTFDSPTPTSSDYLTSGPTLLVSGSSNTVIRWLSANSPSAKRLRDLVLTGEPVNEEPPPPEAGFVRFQGFEGAVTDTWSYRFMAGEGRTAVRSDERGQSGRYALSMTGSDDGASNPFILFDNVDLTGLSNAHVSIGFAARGVDNNDDLYLDVSYDNGNTWPDSTRLVNGFSNFNLDFGQIDPARTVGSNPFTVNIPGAAEQVRVRVRFDEAPGATNRFDHYWIDDVTLTADGTQPRLSFGFTERVAVEGDQGLQLPVTLSSPANASVQVRLSGSAGAGSDFFIAATTLVFTANGSTQALLQVDIPGDGLSQGPRYAHLTLENAAGAGLSGPAQATLWIRDEQSFSVMAANLPSGPGSAPFPYNEAGKRIFRLLRPDVVAIQEWILLPGETEAGFVAEHFGPDFTYFIEPASDFANGVISRWPILASGVWVDTEVGNRDFAWATIDLPGTKDLHVVSVHFKAGSEQSDRDSRIRQARALTNYLATANFPEADYVIIAGDLNLAGRNEETLQILGDRVSDARQPADQNGDLRTNIPRNQHYDFVLPNPILDDAHLPFFFGGFDFTEGIVFDSRLWDDHLLPVRVDDAAEVDMQHLAVMKLFALEPCSSELSSGPTGLTVDPLAMTEATAQWNPVPEIAAYRIDVSTSPSFMTGGEGEIATTVSFSDLPGSPTSQYLTREWTHEGVVWTAFKARTDEGIDGQPAITFQNQTGSYLVSELIQGGVGTVQFVHQQKFTGSGGTLEVLINDFSYGIIAVDTSVQTAKVSGIEVSGPFTLTLRNSGSVRPAVTALSWTTFEAGEPVRVPGYDHRLVTDDTVSVTGLFAGVTYHVRVRAEQAECLSDYSPVVSFTTLPDGDTDTDGDGLPDVWEIAYFNGPTNAVATALAANGINTVWETYVAGLDPTDPNARLEVTFDPGGSQVEAVIFVASTTGRVYDVGWSTNLFDSAGWHFQGKNLPGTGLPLAFEATNRSSAMYWRGRVTFPEPASTE